MVDDQQALDWLFGFTDWERGIGWGIRVSPDLSWNLGRTRWLLDALGSPDRRVPIVLIAGTKGKGSTAALVESIARAAGQHTLLYTQPHLQEYRERIRVDGIPIAPGELAKLTECLHEPVERLIREQPEAGEPTTYEITTAMALLAAELHQADLAIIEVGLGGRLDATNCLDPVISAITRISYDHTQILGKTLEAIAREKVAIARVERPLVSAPQRPAAQRAIMRSAREIGARHRFVSPLRYLGRALLHDMPVQRVGGAFFTTPFEASLALLGDHQRENAAVAVAICEELSRLGHVSIDMLAIRTGLESVRWPGRLELFSGPPRIVLDGAHNGESAARLAAALRESFSFKNLILVLGILRDKDAPAILRELLPAARTVVVTRSANSRSLEPAELARQARQHCDRVRVAPAVSDALDEACAIAGADDLICVTGSLALVGEARELLTRNL
ncbi:MAG: bifunctional folylpolyglutamate synthase/dihydrofolate synthase [Chloroflexota bacterium]